MKALCGFSRHARMSGRLARRPRG